MSSSTVSHQKVLEFAVHYFGIALSRKRPSLKWKNIIELYGLELEVKHNGFNYMNGLANYTIKVTNPSNRDLDNLDVRLFDLLPHDKYFATRFQVRGGKDGREVKGTVNAFESLNMPIPAGKTMTFNLMALKDADQGSRRSSQKSLKSI
jgi:hypothetical protein